MDCISTPKERQLQFLAGLGDGVAVWGFGRGVSLSRTPVHET